MHQNGMHLGKASYFTSNEFYLGRISIKKCIIQNLPLIPLSDVLVWCVCTVNVNYQTTLGFFRYGNWSQYRVGSY